MSTKTAIIKRYESLIGDEIYKIRGFKDKIKSRAEILKEIGIEDYNYQQITDSFEKIKQLRNDLNFIRFKQKAMKKKKYKEKIQDLKEDIEALESEIEDFKSEIEDLQNEDYTINNYKRTRY